MKKLFLSILCLLSFLVSHSAIITVTSTADAGQGSLREAITSAISGDEIVLSFASADSIVLLSTLTIAKNLTITGPGRDILKILAGSAGSRVVLLQVQSGYRVTISGLTFSGAINGPGIRNMGSRLLLENCRLSNNRTGLFNGGWVSPANTSKATLNNCEVINNIGGGGILNQGANGDSSILIVNYCLIKGNKNEDPVNSKGGGIRNTTLDDFNSVKGFGFCYVKNTAIVENIAIGGGGISSSNGGPMIGGTTLLDMENCTISGNRCESTNPGIRLSGGGVDCFLAEDIYEISMLRISHCTIANNYVSGTSGVEAMGLELGTNILSLSDSILSIKHTLIAENLSDDPEGLDITSSFIPEEIDNNLIGIGARFSGPLLPYVGSTGFPLEVKLCPLAMNGGLTPTHSLAGGSPAIDAATSTTLMLDQRDSARIGLPDIGAFEYNPALTSTYTLSGIVTQSNGSPLPNTPVFLIAFDKTDSTLTEVTSTLTNVSGAYSLSVLGPQEYFVKAAPDSSSYPMEIPTYFGGSVVFQEAAGVVVCEDTQANFETIAGANPGGPGFIGGKITDGANKKTGESLEGITVLLIDSASQKVAAYVDTDINGNFLFPDLAISTYQVWVDGPFINNALAPTFTLTAGDPVLKRLKFELLTDKLEWVGIVEGIDLENLWDTDTYSLYPNPAKELLHFTWEENTFGEPLEMAIYDMHGKLLKVMRLSYPGERLIPIDELSSGLYLYAITLENTIKARGKFRKN